MPRLAETSFDPAQIGAALDYINSYWQQLERFHPHDEGTLIGLPRPYIVPSAGHGTGFDFEEMYYWDSFFIAQAFIGTSRHQLARDIAENLLYLIGRFGMIPNGSRSYLTSRSQPPLLTSLIRQIYEVDHDETWLKQAMNLAKDEYRKVWMGVMQPNWRQVLDGLSRYYDANVLHELAESESGWDMTSRFGRQCLDYLPIDLNALLYKYEKDFEEAALIGQEFTEAAEWRNRAYRRASTMQQYLWDDRSGFFFDYNYQEKRRSRVWSLAAYYPMWVGLASSHQAARLVANLDHLELAGGLAATAPARIRNDEVPEQWASPNGWAPLHLIVVQALERYGYCYRAQTIARKWLRTNLDLFEKEGRFYEKYNVKHPGALALEGVYPSQSGFGWTNAVFTNFCRAYLSESELPQYTRDLAAFRS